ncbi:MAG TPA: bifunctional hydroxymethylpyrimidine kinase/phosphomethylpyrimidine kinase [Chloroflexota bacterium]|nr:bifunctional hydroxymethylpyrimidine kinase/phosphomethylpyrimidine kinase [Chloroflexota bacterium]
MTIAKALTIAGSDSGGGAGIQADLKTFAALGVYGTSVLTAVTAQNTRGVFAVQEIQPGVVAAQIDAVMDDIAPAAAKTGMLSSSRIIEVVAERARARRIANLVVDPVMVAKSGDALLRADAVAALKELLLPLALVVTPNLPEAETLAGARLTTDAEIQEAAVAIARLGPRYVVVKGGHREGDAVDLVYDGIRFQTLRAPRIATRHTHGTGCTFSAAITAGLAQGQDAFSAISRAKDYLTGAIARAYPIGEGHSPVHHFYRLWPEDFLP